MKPALQLRISQQLTMTPQLQQAIRLLQLPVLELNEQIQQALVENVMLELEEPPGSAPEVDGSEVIAGPDLDTTPWGEPGGGASGWSGSDAGRPEPADQGARTLRDHLLWQLELEQFEADEVVVGQALIDAIDDAGYLVEPLEHIGQMLTPAGDYPLSRVERVLAKVQALDPAGVGARDLAECLSIQLRQLDGAEPGRELALAVAASSLDLLAEQEYATLRRRLGASEAELELALALIRACHPKPGLAIQPATTEYIVPDVYVRRRDGHWVVEMSRSIAPRLRVNQAYADLVRGDGEHLALRAQLQEARWLVKSLEIRHETIRRVALCIVERQADFLAHGEEAMRPMILRDVAEAVGMHESTISRVTANKYMHTPRGVFEFRYFFSSQLSGEDGSEQSSTAVKAKLRRLVGRENPGRPLSDSRLAAQLAEEGIQVARRTVAKYREELGIPPSNERKKRPVR